MCSVGFVFEKLGGTALRAEPPAGGCGVLGPQRCSRQPSASLAGGRLPDEDTLVVVALPQAAVALVGDGEDVGRQLPQVAPAVALHGGALVQAGDGLVGVHGGDDGADVGLQAQGTPGHTQHWGWSLGKLRTSAHAGTGTLSGGAATCHGSLSSDDSI